MTVFNSARRILLATLSVALCSAAWVMAAARPDVGSGRALYREGNASLQATVAGHEDVLPAEAARCVNCHDGSAAVGPQLTAQWLLEAHERRGGPPSRYDEAAFCRLLREGVDPAFVQLPREMPRYRVTDSDCHALWTFLIHS